MTKWYLMKNAYNAETRMGRMKGWFSGLERKTKSSVLKIISTQQWAKFEVTNSFHYARNPPIWPPLHHVKIGQEQRWTTKDPSAAWITKLLQNMKYVWGECPVHFQKDWSKTSLVIMQTNPFHYRPEYFTCQNLKRKSSKIEIYLN